MVQRIIAGIFVVAGIVMLCISFYIKNEISEGKLKIASAEKKVGQAKSLFSISPITQPIGQGISKSAGRKIRSANEEIAYYTKVAKNLQWGGITAIVVGGILFFVRLKKKRG